MNRELTAASASLVGNHDLLRGILSGCGDCIKILDLDGRLQFMSDGGKRVMEVDDFNAIKGCPWPDFWKDDGNAQAVAAVAAAREGRTARFQNAANTARGTPRHWDVQVSPIVGPDGKVSHLLSISRDITKEWRADVQRRQNAERQKFLTDELTHRVKNTLATVAAIAHQTFRGEMHRDVAAAFQARLQSLGAAYNVLAESNWEDGNVHNIVASAIAPYQTDSDKIRIAGPELLIAPNNALTLALAINELATNAMKYGALSVHEGRVDLRWRKAGPPAAQTFSLEWRETNGPPVVPPTRTGFGSRLVKSVLAQDFKGTVDLRYDPSGLTCRLDAPLGR